MWGVFNLIPSANLLSKSKKRGFVGAFLAGILGGIFSSPCSTPVLIALLAIVAGNGNLLWGILLMLLYSIGHSALVMVAGTSVGFVQRISGNTRYNKAETVLKVIMICPLSSRQVKYLKVSDKNTYISFWSVGIFMHTISLYIF